MIGSSVGRRPAPADALPGHHRRASSRWSRARPGGASSARSSSTTTPRRWRGGAAPGRPRTRGGRPRCASGSRSTPRCRRSDRSTRTGSSPRRARGRPRSRSRRRVRTRDEDLARVEAVRDALGPGGKVRVDANGGWDVDGAVAAIRALARAAGGLEYVEQPCASVDELAAVRRRVDVPVAADESIRRAEDPLLRRACARPPTSRCSRSRRSGACAPRSGWPRRSACRAWCRRRSRARWGSRRASRWPGRCPTCPTPAASAPPTCSPPTSSRPRCTRWPASWTCPGTRPSPTRTCSHVTTRIRTRGSGGPPACAGYRLSPGRPPREPAPSTRSTPT